MLHTYVGRVGSRDESAKVMFAGTDRETKVFHFSLAVRNPRDDNKKPMWVRFTVWGDQAEVLAAGIPDKQLAPLQQGDLYVVPAEMDYDENTGGPRVWLNETTGEVGASFEATVYGRPECLVRANGNGSSRSNGNGLAGQQFTKDENGKIVKAAAGASSDLPGDVQEDDIPF